MSNQLEQNSKDLIKIADDFEKADKESSSKLGEGEVIRWKGRGDKMTARGKAIDYEALGIKPSTIVINGYEVHYTIQDGHFVLFRDNPKLQYYTQGATRGMIETKIADVAKYATDFLVPYKLGSLIKGVPGLKWLDQKDGEVGKNLVKGYPAYLAQNEIIPLWKEIVGTPVPKSGTKEFLLYLSDDDGKKWGRRVIFTITPDGNVSYNIFGPDSKEKK